VTQRHIASCPACGRKHDIEIKLLEKPLAADGLEWTHVYICPQTGIAVYGLFREVAGEQQLMLRP